MTNPGLKLKLKRKECGLTQQEVADYLKISRNTLSVYESGKTDIPLTVFIRISKLYGCDIDEIYGTH